MSAAERAGSHCISNVAVTIDVSPLAVKTCRLRGVRDARVCSIARISRRLGRFETVVMFGNNFGLFGNPVRAKRLLRRLHGMTSPTARIVAESRNPYRAVSADHRRYHQLNRRRGRLPGQLRLRVRHGHSRTPWFDYLMVSPGEMRGIVAGTGWRLARLIGTTGPIYIAVLQKIAVEHGTAAGERQAAKSEINRQHPRGT